VRCDGKLIPVPTAWKTRYIDFGNGRDPSATVTLPWGDVSTAYYTTGIPNIEVYMAFKPWSRWLIKLSRYLQWLLGSAPVQGYFRSQVKRMPRGATDEQRARSISYVWGEVRDDSGHIVTGRLTTPDGYGLTVLTALAIVELALGGHHPIGFQTPARAYGPDFIFTIPGVTRLP
jgi:short subunit dehydrogenase-like uncharacterized protein